MEHKDGPDGEPLYVDDSDGMRGSDGPFFVVYRDRDRDRRWGFFCDQCETMVSTMDSMGRLRCPNCDNFTKPDEWDAAHE